ncbi:MAG: hypothetical protein FJZ01_12235 [Candidatus Sericytochromatia bacterium]|nr:hypothetical protein [Candidatus Tanganyikabacteria bacterium]
MKLRKLAGLVALLWVAGCSLPGEAPPVSAGLPGSTSSETLAAPRMVGVDVTAQVTSPAATSAYRTQYAYSEVAKVAIGLYERSTDASTNPLLGYFYPGNSAATSSITLSATEFTNFRAALGTSISVGSSDKTALRRYLMRTFTSPLPGSMATSFSNFPIATDSAPVHSYNIFLAAFDSAGALIGYKEADLTYSILSQANPSMTLTASLNYGGLGQINLGRTLEYSPWAATGSMEIVAGVFDKAATPHLGFTSSGGTFNGASKAYFSSLSSLLTALGESDTANSSRFLIKEYASPSAPAGAGTNYFYNLPSGSTRYRSFLLAVRGGSEIAGRYLSAEATVSTDSTTSIAAGTFETGYVETYASGIPTWPFAIAIDSSENVYVGAGTYLQKYASGTVVATYGGAAFGWLDSASGSPRFDDIKGLALDGSGNVFVGDCNNHSIRKVASNAAVTTVAGLGPTGAGWSDSASGSPKFNCPRGLALDSGGNLYVADSLNHAIRKISSNGTVTTLAGGGVSGYQEDTGTLARFNTPVSLALSADGGTLYVGDTVNRRVRKINTATGATSLVAGTGNCCADEGPDGSQVPLNTPAGLALGSDGYLYMADQGQCAVRTINTTAPHAVRRIAGQWGSCGQVDGSPLATSRFGAATGVALFAGAGLRIYVTEETNRTVRRIR